MPACYADHAASGTARARASADARRASITRSGWSETRSNPRARSGVRAYSFFSLPNSRSTAAGLLIVQERLAFRLRRETRRRGRSAPVNARLIAKNPQVRFGRPEGVALLVAAHGRLRVPPTAASAFDMR